MPWNYIKCENYGSFAAHRNRETTEPEIFMLPNLLKVFLIISLRHTTGFSFCNRLPQRRVGTKHHPGGVGPRGAVDPSASYQAGSVLSLKVVIKCQGRDNVSRVEQAAGFYCIKSDFPSVA